jgi:large conductance mechanosensitive channel
MSRTKTELKGEKSSTGTIERMKKPFDGFIEFLAEYSIIGMAIGIIIGTTTKDTVDALVEGLITPTIQLFLPNPDLQNLVITTGKAEFNIGLFIDAFLQMIIVMALLYIVLGVLFRRKDLISKKSKKK